MTRNEQYYEQRRKQMAAFLSRFGCAFKQSPTGEWLQDVDRRRWATSRRRRYGR